MGSGTVIELWVCDLTFPGYMDRMRSLGEQFERAHPEYRVVIEGHDFRKLPHVIADAVSRGRAPAVAEYYFSASQTARDMRRPDGSPLFTSVERAIGGRAEVLGEPVVLGDVIPAIADYYTVDGEYESMPSVSTTPVLYANTALLEAAGIGAMPRTWDELEAACRTVAERLPGGPSHGVNWPNHGLFFQQALGVQGGRLAEPGPDGRITTVDLSSKEMMTWVKWWQRMSSEGHYLYTGKIPDWLGSLQVFAAQQVALRISSSNDINYMVRAATDAGFGIEVAPFPHAAPVPGAGSATAGTGFWLADGLDEATRDGALALLQYMHNPRNAADRHKENSFVPLTRASFRLLEEEGWFAEHPYHRVPSDQLETTRGALPSLPFGDFVGAQDVMTRAMHDVLVAGADPDERFEQATAEAQQLLDDYHADCAGTGPKSFNSLRVEYFRDADEYSGADLENVLESESGERAT